MKRLSLVWLTLIILGVLGCVLPLAAQDEGEIAYLVYRAISDGEDVVIRGLNAATGEDVLIMSLPGVTESGTKYQDVLPSSNGRLLVGYYSKEEDLQKSELFWVDVATQEMMPIYQADKRVSTPIWSPDGQYIAFRTANEDNTYDDFWLYDVSTETLINPLTKPSTMSAYSWSLDGHSLVGYVVERNTKAAEDPACEHCPSRIDLIDLPTAERTFLLDDAAWAVELPRSSRDVVCTLRLSPNQKKLLFVVGCIESAGYDDLYLLDIASNEVMPILTSKDITGYADHVESYLSPAWIDDETIWVGYFMEVPSVNISYETRVYHLDTLPEYEAVGRYGMYLIARHSEILVAELMDDSIAYVGALEDIGSSSSTLLYDLCDRYVSSDQRLVAYQNCETSTALTLIDLQTGRIEPLSLPDKSGLIGWLTITQTP